MTDLNIRLSLNQAIGAILILVALGLSGTAMAREAPKGKPLSSAGATSQTYPKAGGASPNIEGIIADALGETEFRAANEIAAVVASGQETGPNGEAALRVVPAVGKGGPQTVKDVLTLPNSDFGIVPLLVLDRLRASKELGDLGSRIAYAAPLFVEEVHVLAKVGIQSVTDLANKTVGVGEEDGATEFLARELFQQQGIKVQEAHLSLPEMLAALKSGDIDAAVVVSGKPVDALAEISSADGLHLVPLPSPPPGFLPSTFGREDYPELVKPGERVQTLGVQSVLIAYNWPPKSERGRLAQFFLNTFFWRLPELQVPPRHPKWREVNIAGIVPGWSRLAAAETWLKKTAPGTEERALRAEFDRFLGRTGGQIGAQGREALFQDFLRWRNAPSATGAVH